MKKYFVVILLISGFCSFLSQQEEPESIRSQYKTPPIPKKERALNFKKPIRIGKNTIVDMETLKQSQRDLPHLEIARTIADLYKNANMVSSNLDRVKIYNTWRTKPSVMNFFKKALTKPNELSEKISPDQLAASRVYGIKFFHFLAQSGESEPILNAINEVIFELSNEKASRIKGREIDLADLTASYISTIQPKEISSLSGIKNLFRTLNLDSIKANKVRSIIDDELFMHIYPIVGKKNASSLINLALSQI